MSTAVSVANATPVATCATTSLPAIGAPLGGGFFTGVINVDSKPFALITAGIAGHLVGKLLPGSSAVDGSSHRADGMANTEALAGAGSELAQQALSLVIDGHKDWYIPARDEQELQYRAFKPTDYENFADGEDGENPSSTPPGEAYTEESPIQTVVENFRAGAADAFEDWWYWSSTQHASDPSNAWFQHFYDGLQYYDHKDNEGRVRVVRRLPI